MAVNIDGLVLDKLYYIGNKYNIKKIILFGSRARGDNRNNSDIDIAVYLKSEKDKGAIYDEINDIETLYKIDIVFVNKSTDIELLKNIDRDGVILYEDN